MDVNQEIQFYQVNVNQTNEVNQVIQVPVSQIEKPPSSENIGTSPTEIILAYAVLFTAVCKGISLIFSRNDNKEEEVGKFELKR